MLLYKEAKAVKGAELCEQAMVMEAAEEVEGLLLVTLVKEGSDAGAASEEEVQQVAR